MSGCVKPEHGAAERGEGAQVFRYRQQLRPRRIGQDAETKHERHRQPREEVADHRLVRPYPGPRQQRARRLRMLRPQQVEPHHDRAHQIRRGHSRTRRPLAENRLTQAFALQRDAGETPVERLAPAQRVPDGNKGDQNRQRGETGDQVVDAEPVRQPVFQPEIVDPGAEHRGPDRAQISKRAILTMIAIPVTSIRIASPTSIIPRTSVYSGAI